MALRISQSVQASNAEFGMLYPYTGRIGLNKSELNTLEAWCQHAITILAGSGVPDQVVKLQRAAVSHFATSKKLYGMAEDLAEGLQDLPKAEREAASEELTMKHGFSFEGLLENKNRRIIALIKRGGFETMTSSGL